jgi:hypothetical protein
MRVTYLTRSDAGQGLCASTIPSSCVLPCYQVPDVARAMELGREAAEVISKAFPPPVKLEFEKVGEKHGNVELRQ